MRRVIRLPKVQLSMALFAVFLSAFGQLPLNTYLYILIVVLGSTILWDMLISYIRIRKLFFPYAAIATGLIITLLIDPTLEWYKILSITFIAMAIKNFVRLSNKHIFNPAAAGLFAGGLVLGSYVAWWGSSFQYSGSFNIQSIIFYAILLSPLYISAYRLRRYYAIASFFLSYVLISIIITGNFSISSLFISLANPTIIFFGAVMLPEPMTSPSDRTKQILFGLTVAVLSFLLTSQFVTGLVFIPDSLIASLLIANLLFFKR